MKKFIQHILEKLLITHQIEQRHAGLKFQVVWIAHDPVYGVVQLQKLPAYPPQLTGQHRYRPVSNSLVHTLDFIVHCHSAVAKTLNLGENIPHPVAFLSACFDFLQSDFVIPVVGASESVQRKLHSHSPFDGLGLYVHPSFLL